MTLQPAGRPCAECRRLKHKCDRTVPCSNCVKKGCSDICPQGINATGQGHRRFWTRTHEMRDTLAELARRIAALELALQESYAVHSALTHPLLAPTLLSLKDPHLPSGFGSTDAPQFSSTRTKSTSSDSDDDPALVAKKEDISDCLGSLSINRFGRTRYFGTAALSSFLLQNEHPADAPEAALRDSSKFEQLLPGMGIMSSTFPLSMLNNPFDDHRHERLAMLRHHLPIMDDADRLKTLYYTHAAALNCPVTPQEFDVIASAIYEQQSWTTSVTDANDLHEHHLFAVAFLIFAIGSLLDPLLEPNNQKAHRYYEHACAALFGSHAVDHPTPEAIQAVSLMSSYVAYAGKGSDHHSYAIEWTLMGMAVKMAQSMGLHRDPGEFEGLTPAEMEGRRRLWWNVYKQDVQSALKWGLPPSFSSILSDTKLPTSHSTTPDGLSYLWKYTFCRDCLEPLQQRVFAVARPDYQVVLELDRKLRSHPLPQVLQYRPITDADLEPQNSKLTLQRSFVTMMKESVMLLLHRSWCDRATRENAADPLSSPYGASVIACYRSAYATLAVASTAYERLTHPTTRLSCFFYQTFTAAATLSAIVSRCPSLAFVPDALRLLDRTHDITQRCLQQMEPQRLLVTFTDMRDNARASYNSYLSGSQLDPEDPSVARIQDVFACLGGKTRSVVRPPVDGTADVANVSDLASLDFSSEFATMHPSVLEYLQAIGL